jgi:hypothetical protein
MKKELEHYIFEQILILEKKQLIEENKVLKGLAAAGLSAAVYFATVFLQNDDVTPEDVTDKAEQTSTLSQSQLDQIKRGAEEAQRLIDQGTNPKNIIIHQKEPGVAIAFKTLFMNSDQPTDAELENLESGEKISIASVEEVTQEHIDHVFKYTPEQVQEYLNTESARNSLTINFGEEEICLLDVGQSELSEIMNNPNSKAFKHVAKEVLSRRIQAREATFDVIQAFSEDYDNTLDQNKVIDNIKSGSRDSIGVGKAIESYMKNKDSDAYLNIVIDAFNNGKVKDQSRVDDFIDNTDLDDFYSEDSENGRRDIYNASEEVINFLAN